MIKNIEDSIAAINSGATDKYKLFIVVESIEDAAKLAEGTSCIKSINLGGTKAKEGTRNISKAVNILPKEEEILNKFVDIQLNILSKTVPMNKTKNEFRQELNRILRLCQDKIVQVSSNLEVDTTNVIDVKDFGEIVKVSEELFKPILYWISPRNDEAWFTVMSHGLTYRYILKK